MIMIKKTDWYFSALPYVLTVFNVCGLPFFPLYPNQFLILMAMAHYATVYINCLFGCDTLFQAVPLILIQYISLAYRMHV